MTIRTFQAPNRYGASLRIRDPGPASDHCIRQHELLPLRALRHATGDHGCRPTARSSRFNAASAVTTTPSILERPGEFTCVPD